MSIDIILSGAFGLTGLMMFVGYLFYDKDKYFSALLVFPGIILACLLINKHLIAT